MEIICHHIFASIDDAHDNLVQCQPLLRIGLAIICVHPDLVARRPSNGPQSYRERTKSRSVGDEWCSGAAKGSVLGVILLSVLNFHIMAHRSAILDTVTYINVGVDALVDVVR